MTNIIILFCCILVGFLVGRYLSKRVKNREIFFADLKRYLSLLNVNVRGRCVDLTTFNREFALNCSELFANFLTDGKPPNFLDVNQKQLVAKAFLSLSATTSAELLSNLEYFEQLVSSQLSSMSNASHNANMYSKLGVLLGVMVGILLM